MRQPVRAVLVALAAAVVALVGVVALRVRGLYLAVATLIVAWMADEYLFVVPWFAGTGGSATLNTPRSRFSSASAMASAASSS